MSNTYTPSRDIIDRKIIFSDYISNTTVSDIIEKILNINLIDDINEKEYKDYERDPIKLFINTFGGSVYDGLALFDTIELSKTPIYTISVGSSMSMGLIILLAGHKRYATKHSTILYHEISSFVCDKLTSIKLEVKEMERLQIILDNIVLKKTSITKKKLEEIKNKKDDWYIDTKIAIKLGIINSVYNNQ